MRIGDAGEAPEGAGEQRTPRAGSDGLALGVGSSVGLLMHGGRDGHGRTSSRRTGPGRRLDQPAARVGAWWPIERRDARGPRTTTVRDDHRRTGAAR